MSQNSGVELVRSLRRGVVGVLAFPEIEPTTPREEIEQRLAVNVSKGTAFSISPDRFLTCEHVIRNIDVNKLKLAGSLNPEGGPPLFMLDVIEVRSDSELDIALLRTRQSQIELVPITLESGQPKVGLDILAVGYPLPQQQPPQVLENERRVNVAVHHTFRAVRGIIASRLPGGTRFEIDKLVNPGQSGGPVISMENGQLVGMCEAFLTYQRGEQTMPSDLSVCISAEAIRSKLSEWGSL
jgi:S1-C subfamily serine protease